MAQGYNHYLNPGRPRLEVEHVGALHAGVEDLRGAQVVALLAPHDLAAAPHARERAAPRHVHHQRPVLVRRAVDLLARPQKQHLRMQTLEPCIYKPRTSFQYSSGERLTSLAHRDRTCASGQLCIGSLRVAVFPLACPKIPPRPSSLLQQSVAILAHAQVQHSSCMAWLRCGRFLQVECKSWVNWFEV